MAAIGQRRDIESKLTLIAERIVRGKFARNNKEVRFYRWNKYVTIVSTALTSIGLSHPLLAAYGNNGQPPTIQQIINSLTGLPLVILILGIGGFISLIVLRRMYEAENVEQKAIESLALCESFTRLEVDFLKELECEEPLIQLEPVRQAAHVLERNAALIIPDRNSLRDSIQKYTNDIIAQRCSYWAEAMPSLERQENSANNGGGN